MDRYFQAFEAGTLTPKLYNEKVRDMCARIKELEAQKRNLEARRERLELPGALVENAVTIVGRFSSDH